MQKIISLAAIGSLLTGCAVHQQAIGTINSDMRTASDLLVAKRNQSMSNVERSAGIYLGDAPIRTKTRSLPPLFDKKVDFNKNINDLNALAEAITGMSGVLCRVTDDALNTTSGQQSIQQSASTPSMSMPASGSLPPPPPPIGTSGTQGNTGGAYNGGRRSAFIQPYSGSLRGFLDMATTRFGVSWKFEDGQIIIFALDTKVFQISSLPGDIDVSAQVGNTNNGSGSSANTSGGSGGSVTTNSQQMTKTTTKLTPWGSIEANVKSMLSPQGRVMSSPATNSLVVTDTPPIIERVSEYIERENKRLSQRVDLYVKVYKVSVSKGEDYGLDWTAVYDWMAKNTSVSLGRAANLSTNGAGTTNLSFSVNAASKSPWAGSQMIFKALATQGDVSELTSAHVSPLNNRPTPIFVGSQIGYLARVTTSNTQSISSTSLEPGTISSGFTLNLLPSVMERGRINLRYSMDLASLIRLTKISSGDQQIQVPEIDSRSLMLDTAVQSGETLVIAGFEQSSSALNRSGTFSPANILFGGESQAKTGKDVLVVVISSYLVGR